MIPKNQTTKGAMVTSAFGSHLLNDGPGSRASGHCQDQEVALMGGHSHPRPWLGVQQLAPLNECTAHALTLRKPVMEGWCLCSHHHRTTNAHERPGYRSSKNSGSKDASFSLPLPLQNAGYCTEVKTQVHLPDILSAKSYNQATNMFYPPTLTNTPS